MKALKGSAIVLALISVLLGGIIGYAVGSASRDNPEDNSAETVDSQKTVPDELSDFRVNFQAELQEHVTLASSALTTAHDLGPEDEKTQAALAELDRNSVAISEIIADVLPDQETAFLAQWRNHINYLAEFTLAVKEDDADSRASALANLNTYTDEATQFFVNNISAINESDIRRPLEEHRQLITDAIEAYARGNYTEYYTEVTEALNQASVISDVIYEAVSQDFSPPPSE